MKMKCKKFAKLILFNIYFQYSTKKLGKNFLKAQNTKKRQYEDNKILLYWIRTVKQFGKEEGFESFIKSTLQSSQKKKCKSRWF